MLSVCLDHSFGIFQLLRDIRHRSDSKDGPSQKANHYQTVPHILFLISDLEGRQFLILYYFPADQCIRNYR